MDEGKALKAAFFREAQSSTKKLGAIQTDVFASVFFGTPNRVRQEVCRKAAAERGAAYPKARHKYQLGSRPKKASLK
jgi:hypothetical protein